MRKRALAFAELQKQTNQEFPLEPFLCEEPAALERLIKDCRGGDGLFERKIEETAEPICPDEAYEKGQYDILILRGM